jgi:hypothetical protein
VATKGGFANLTNSGRNSGGFAVTWYGADALNESLDKMGKELVWNDNGELIPRRLAANREIRAAAKAIGDDLLVPMMKRTARSSPTPQARAMAETARAKSDRLIMVQVGGVNPPLRGFKRGVGKKRAAGRSSSSGRDASSRTYRTTLAWGSEFGPKGGRHKPSGRSGIPARAVNHYKAARNERGYWVLPAVENVMTKAQDRWDEAITRIINRYTGRG